MELTRNWDIDWLAFCYKNPDPEKGFTTLERFFEDFPMFKDAFFEYNENTYSLTGYQLHFKLYDGEHAVLVAYNVRATKSLDQGVYISFSGSSLFIFYKLFNIDLGKVTLFDLFQWLASKKCSLCRIDLKYDDFDKVYTPHQYGKLYMDKQMSTRIRKVWFVASESTKGGTFYMGNKKKLLRIYDKDYESKGEIPAIRYEFQLKSDMAKVFFEQILTGCNFDMFSWLLNDWFRVLEKPCEDKNNRSKVATDKAWEDFVKVKFSINLNEVEVKYKKRKSTYKKKKEWFEIAMAKMVTLILEEEEDGLDYYRKLSERTKLSPDYVRYRNELKRQRLEAI